MPIFHAFSELNRLFVLLYLRLLYVNEVKQIDNYNNEVYLIMRHSCYPSLLKSYEVIAKLLIVRRLFPCDLHATLILYFPFKSLKVHMNMHLSSSNQVCCDFTKWFYIFTWTILCQVPACIAAWKILWQLLLKNHCFAFTGLICTAAVVVTVI